MPTTSLTAAPTAGKPWGRSTIDIDVSAEELWQWIADSKVLEVRGPPVKKVDVDLTDGMTSEGVGARRRVWIEMAGKRLLLVERRVIHEAPVRLGYAIEQDAFLGWAVRDSGFTMTLTRINERRTRMDFRFFQRPRGVLGVILWPLVLALQAMGRRMGLASLKRTAEAARNSAQREPIPERAK